MELAGEVGIVVAGDGIVEADGYTGDDLVDVYVVGMSTGGGSEFGTDTVIGAVVVGLISEGGVEFIDVGDGDVLFHGDGCG